MKYDSEKARESVHLELGFQALSRKMEFVTFKEF